MLHMAYRGPIEYLHGQGALVMITEDCHKGCVKAKFDARQVFRDGRFEVNGYAFGWNQFPAKDFYISGGCNDPYSDV